MFDLFVMRCAEMAHRPLKDDLDFSSKKTYNKETFSLFTFFCIHTPDRVKLQHMYIVRTYMKNIHYKETYASKFFLSHSKLIENAFHPISCLRVRCVYVRQ